MLKPVSFVFVFHTILSFSTDIIKYMVKTTSEITNSISFVSMALVSTADTSIADGTAHNILTLSVFSNVFHDINPTSH